ncbi:arylamine N-acetyltransferase [Pseudomonas koreensis]|uniref:Arylamine N-acetyltransferase n=2 Tax=Pseudomonas TaxID=286 RepID=A0A4Q4L2C6_9PSED|nr:MULTISPECIES: arylamine N-acetyltransferase [Pseudomonas]MDM8192094.1 arylamine N-acetyltransferase [Pseudomonas fluorescens]MDP8573339.1 arylamine N-acetyltransferase [Pseudomonas iranensis]RYM40243.1 arylamine N-acetyltransferase [Pseudomonas koreensis]
MSVARLTNTNLYLQRLGFDAPPPPTLQTLRQMQLRHTAEFVFENLATVSGVPVLIDLDSIESKVLRQGRGGYCYELNHLFYALLLELGFEARGISGRVVMNQPEGSWTARTHRLSLVTIEDTRYIADVGFGGMVPTAPLLLDSEDEQPTPHEPYCIEKLIDGYLLRAKVAGEWRPMYLFDLQRQEHIDYTVGNWYVSTHPDSPFAQRLMVARTGDGWRKTLNNGSFAIHHMGADSERREVADIDELMKLLRREFDLQVPDSPRVRQALARVIAPASI